MVKISLADQNQFPRFI